MCPGWTNVEEVNNILDEVLHFVKVIASNTAWTVQYKGQINWRLTYWDNKKKGKRNIKTAGAFYKASYVSVPILFLYKHLFSKRARNQAWKQMGKCQLARWFLVTNFISSCVQISPRKLQNQWMFGISFHPKELCLLKTLERENCLGCFSHKTDLKVIP